MVYDEFVYCCGISVCIHYIHVYVCACVIGRILGIVLDMISPVACPSIFSGEVALLKTMYNLASDNSPVFALQTTLWQIKI